MERLREEMGSLLQNRTGGTHWIEQFKKHRNLTELTRHIAVTLIDRIEVCEDCRIQIRFKYQDSYERALSLIESVEKIQPLDIAAGGDVISPINEALLSGNGMTAFGEGASRSKKGAVQDGEGEQESCHIRRKGELSVHCPGKDIQCGGLCAPVRGGGGPGKEPGVHIHTALHAGKIH